jgi:hypothetical protein
MSDSSENSQVSFALPEGLELDSELKHQLKGEMETQPEIFEDLGRGNGSDPPQGFMEDPPPILLLDTAGQIDIDFGDISHISLDRRTLKRVAYWGSALLTDKASQKKFSAYSRDLHKEGVGLAFTGQPPEIGDELILEFIGDENLKPLSIEVVVTSVESKSDGKFSYVGLKVSYAGSMAQRRIEDYVKKRA